MGARSFFQVVLFGFLLQRQTGAEKPGATVSPLPCTEENKAGWQQVRLQLRDQLPRLHSRLPFSLYRSDVEFLEELREKAAALEINEDHLFGASAGTPHAGSWSECASGLLLIKIIFALTQVEPLPAQTPEAAVRMVSNVLSAPWVEMLLGGWPVFSALALLSRWASPHANKHLIQVAGTHARAANQAANNLGSCECDKADIGAVARARTLLGNLWRHADRSAPLESSVAALAEEALSGVSGAVWGGSAGPCRWTEHRGFSLGSSLSIGVDSGKGVLGAMAICDGEAACSGISIEQREDGTSNFMLRSGDPVLLEPLEGEHCYVRWCLDGPVTTEEKRPPCPFARASGLLASAVRRLSRGSMGDFAAEDVIEAQGLVKDWAVNMADQRAVGVEAWTTEWPIWVLLGRLQQRIDLLHSPVIKGTAAPQPWSVALQGALGFGDDQFRMALEELTSVVGENGLRNRLPSALLEGASCSSGQKCLGELYARLHSLLHSSGHLPLRDAIFLQPDDMLGPAFMERGKIVEEGIDYDWGKMIVEAKERMREGADKLETRTEALDRLMPREHPLQVDRRQLANFILEVRELVVPNPLGRCLEWDQPFLLVRAFQGYCRWFDIFSYSEPDPENPRMGAPGHHEYAFGTRHYWGDLEYEGGLGISPDTFDLILCPFVFEHISRPFKAMKNLAKVLRSGGHIIWAAPMFQSYHGSPHDYYRYTPNGARALAEDAGLEVVKLYAPGDLGLTSGVMHGMMLPYWSERQALSEEAPHPKEDFPRYPMNVFALMRKPPLAESKVQ